MSTTTFCDSCHCELQLKGNGIKPGHPLSPTAEKWRVFVEIFPAFRDHPADLCRDCTVRIAKAHIGQLPAPPPAQSGKESGK